MRVWFAFDATRQDKKGTGFRFLGSFVNRKTAMQAVESETIQTEATIPHRANVAEVQKLTFAMLGDPTDHAFHSDRSLRDHRN